MCTKVSFDYYRRVCRDLLIKPATAAAIAEPMTAQIIGKELPPMLTGKSIGSPNSRAIHVPMYAPMMPIKMDTRQPPVEYPTIDWPMPPQIAAISKRMSSSVSVIGILSTVCPKSIRRMNYLSSICSCNGIGNALILLPDATWQTSQPLVSL